MKLKKSFFICLVVSVCFFNVLQGDKTVLKNQQIHKGQTEDAQELLSVVHLLTNAREKYLQKNDGNQKIRCKSCTIKELFLSEFEGGLIGWALKAIVNGGNEFEKIRSVLDEYIKLLSSQTSPIEVENFMLNVSNNQKQVCSLCHGVLWKKSSE